MKFKYWLSRHYIVAGTLVLISYILAWLAGAALLIGAGAFIVGATERSQLKYNCQLDTYPSYRIALIINTDPYAYDPVGFCKTLKERMEKK